eukprot:gnl/TRDRNA2_/TRDRNA2_169971_c1_seq1.p1 gnl/TRDRNA2_/TRDRNA2_169971_c1~~gnl/TRDRNA2_/TRDRNA2_169971_c1_seq1.p1  ORF type:complete len:319 (-),score=61.74 gnl/TRDRNA2_/TRDRNA2_169971_c1_seq1:35-991(-)
MHSEMNHWRSASRRQQEAAELARVQLEAAIGARREMELELTRVRQNSVEASDGDWRQQVDLLHSELRLAEDSFSSQLSSLRGRLVAADRRNRELCESLQRTVQAATEGQAASLPSSAPAARHHPAAAATRVAPSHSNGRDAGPWLADAPAAAEMPAPGFGARSGAIAMGGLRLGAEEAAGNSGGPSSPVPRAGDRKPPRSLQRDYLRFVDETQKSSSELISDWHYVGGPGASRAASPSSASWASHSSAPHLVPRVATMPNLSQQHLLQHQEQQQRQPAVMRGQGTPVRGRGPGLMPPGGPLGSGSGPGPGRLGSDKLK